MTRTCEAEGRRFPSDSMQDEFHTPMKPPKALRRHRIGAFGVCRGDFAFSPRLPRPHGRAAHWGGSAQVSCGVLQGEFWCQEPSARGREPQAARELQAAREPREPRESQHVAASGIPDSQTGLATFPSEDREREAKAREQWRTSILRMQPGMDATAGACPASAVQVEPAHGTLMALVR